MRRDVDQIASLSITSRLSRREVITRLAILGLSSSGIVSAVTGAGLRAARARVPTKRGASGVLKLLYWQAPTILNAHFASGTKDVEASRVCTESLLSVSAAGVFSPVLAAEVPTRANGGLSADGRSVTYKLKRGIRWADGRPFSADDVVFTFQLASNREAGTISYAFFENVEKTEALDPHTVKITFKTPTPA